MYELIQHTADIRMRVSAASLEELFAEALRGLMAIADPRGETAEVVRTHVAIEAPDVTVLLVDFLNCALTEAHVQRARFDAVAFATLQDTSLSASLDGVRVAGFEEDVKAVTYHEADVVRHDGMWSTVLVFDI